jgi:hypothetical protein
MAERRVMAPREWTHAATIRALKAASVDGVAPAARDWTKASGDHPSRAVVGRLFGTFAEACTAAQLETAAEGGAKRRAARHDEQVRQLRTQQGESKPPRERARQRWVRERSERRKIQMAEDVAAGRLVIRQASPAELARFAEERARAAPIEPPPAPEVELELDGADLEAAA